MRSRTAPAHSGLQISLALWQDRPLSVQVAAQLSTEELLKAVSQLAEDELEQFMRQVIALGVRRRASSLPPNEAQLLMKINGWIPSELQDRYSYLIRRRQEEALTEAELAELLQMTEQVEALEGERLKNLAELARIRGTSLPALIKDLGVSSYSHA